MKRIITIPLGPVKVPEGIMPILDHPHSTRLFHVSQLGPVERPYPGGRHSRGEHALGVLRRTEIRARRLCRGGMLEEADVLPLTVAGFCHDHGHPAFSHFLEELLPVDHKQNGLRILGEMSETFVQCGVDVGRILAILTGSDPKGQVISHKTLGTDKLDYLTRDQHHTAFGQSIEPSRLELHVLYKDGVLGVHRKAVNDLELLQDFYATVYRDLYFRKSGQIAGRVLQKLYLETVAEGHVRPHEVLDMTDWELLGRAERCLGQAGRELYRRFRHFTQVPKAAVCFRHSDTIHVESPDNGHIAPHALSDELMARAVRLSLEHDVPALEKRVAEAVALPEHDVAVLRPPLASRFVPADVVVFGGGKAMPLSSLDPHHFKSMQAKARGTVALYVCVPPEHRERVARHAGTEVYRIVREYLAAHE